MNSAAASAGPRTETGLIAGTAEALAEDLRRFRAGEPICARPAGWWGRGTKWVRRRPTLAALTVISVVASVALVSGGLIYNAQLRWYNAQLNAAVANEQIG